MADYKKQLRITESKKACKCAETDLKIGKFEDILLDPISKQAYCTKSKKYQDFAEKMKKSAKK